MARSLYKVPFVHKSLFEKCLLNKKTKFFKKNFVEDEKKTPRYLIFWVMSSCIPEYILDKKISLFNGKVFLSLIVDYKTLGYKLNNFCITRRKPLHIGKKRQVKKVDRSKEKLINERKRIINKHKKK